MIFRAPKYYKEFHCIANNCKDSCCQAGWEIDIDKETEYYYREVEGEFGNKLRESITNENDPEESVHFILREDKKCPFFNENKLCDIYTKLGEEHLCQICKDHPRFYEWFEFAGVKEAGVGLCCEEAARIILSQVDKFSCYEENIYDVSDDIISYSQDNKEDDMRLYNYLFSAREKIINYLDTSNNKLNNKLKNILWYGQTLQQNIDNNLLDDEEIIDIDSKIKTNINPIISYMSSLEPNDEKWPNYLRNCSELSDTYYKKIAEFENNNPEVENYLKNIAIYFIWRYFLKGVFDGDVLSEIKLMYVSCNVLKYLFFCKWLEKEETTLTLDNCINIVKKYSEEVEYSEDNLVDFANDSYDLECLETNYLLGI